MRLLKIIPFANTDLQMSVEIKFTWWAILLTGNICLYRSAIILLAAAQADAWSDTTAAKFPVPTSVITSFNWSARNVAVWELAERFFMEWIISFWSGVKITNAYKDCPKGLVQLSNPN